MEKHPLATASLTPFGYCFPDSEKRLSFMPYGLQLGPDQKLVNMPDRSYVNRERFIARAWDRANRRHPGRQPPAETIIHVFLPRLSRTYECTYGDFEFDGKPYLSRDIVVLSTVVQWLGTNVGNCFLESTVWWRSNVRPSEEFLVKLERERELGHNPLIYLLHQCNEECARRAKERPGSHHFVPESITPRDEALVQALFMWFGTDEGRSFISNYLSRRRHVEDGLRARNQHVRQAA